MQTGGDGLSECEVQSHLRNHLPQVKETDVRGEEGVQDEVEGLVDVQISLDNGDHNLFKGSVEVQCQVHNEQESDQVEHTEKEKVRKRNIATVRKIVVIKFWIERQQEMNGNQMSLLALRKVMMKVVLMTVQVIKKAGVVLLGHLSCQIPWLTISGM